MATASFGESLLTAEEFGARPDPGYPEELVRGRIVRMPPPRPRHGEICVNVSYLLSCYIKEHNLGRVVSNDSGVITERGPDTVRGADVAFYSYERVPKGPMPNAYLEVVPELIFEVLSPSDRWPDVLHKVAEYLEAGVSVVVVLDGTHQSADIYALDIHRTLGPEEELAMPEILAGFRIAVRRFFE
jgi:Uma2 family endonuclease